VWNISRLSPPDYTAQHPRSRSSSLTQYFNSSFTSPK
jgi:hypothetical protein